MYNAATGSASKRSRSPSVSSARSPSPNKAIRESIGNGGLFGSVGRADTGLYVKLEDLQGGMASFARLEQVEKVVLAGVGDGFITDEGVFLSCITRDNNMKTSSKFSGVAKSSPVTGNVSFENSVDSSDDDNDDGSKKVGNTGGTPVKSEFQASAFASTPNSVPKGEFHGITFYRWGELAANSNYRSKVDRTKYVAGVLSTRVRVKSPSSMATMKGKYSVTRDTSPKFSKGEVWIIRKSDKTIHGRLFGNIWTDNSTFLEWLIDFANQFASNHNLE